MNMSGNPMYEKASHSNVHVERDAALALAWEQRTANLIGLLGVIAPEYRDGSISDEGRRVARELRTQIYRRVGIEEDE